MNKEKLFELTKHLSDEGGVVGDEEKTTAILEKALQPYVKEIKYDRFGNLISFKPGKKDGATVILEAHIDEIGLIVDYIDENGFIYFKKLGVWEARILPAQRIKIRTRKHGDIHGIVGMRPLHIETIGQKDNKAWRMNELFIDIGAKSADSVIKAGVRKGDCIFMDRELIRLEVNSDIITGKALDNRLGCACMVDVMDILSKENHEANIYAIGSMQAELALNGGFNLSSEMLKPDVIIVFDTTVAGDVPGVHPKDSVSRIGDGAIIKLAEYGEWPHGHVVHKKLVDLIVETAEEEKIPYQLEVLEEATTTATAIQHALGGCAAGAISVPTRYLHCPTELADINDAIACSKLTAATMKKITSKYISYLYSR